jgi:hypothetical protein
MVNEFGERTGSFIESTLYDTSANPFNPKLVAIVIVCAPRYLNPGCQGAYDNAVVSECPQTSTGITHCPAGTVPWRTTYYFGNVSNAKIGSGEGHQWYSVTSWIQAVGFVPGSPKKLVYRYYNTTLSAPGTYDTLLVESDFTVDVSGSLQYSECATYISSCGFGATGLSWVAPTNVVLANAGPYPKVTWSNNGDTADSTEVWFGKDCCLVKVGVFSASTTQYTGQWSGSGIYRAKVARWYNRKNFNVTVQTGFWTAFIYSNSLTH